MLPTDQTMRRTLVITSVVIAIGYQIAGYFLMRHEDYTISGMVALVSGIVALAGAAKHW